MRAGSTRVRDGDTGNADVRDAATVPRPGRLIRAARNETRRIAVRSGCVEISVRRGVGKLASIRRPSKECRRGLALALERLDDVSSGSVGARDDDTNDRSEIESVVGDPPAARRPGHSVCELPRATQQLQAASVEREAIDL